MTFYGLCDLPWWGMLTVLLVFTHLTVLAVTIFLHRCQTHRGLDLHPIVSHFFRFWLWMNTGMITQQWVAVHRKHHARCETVEDPHSPQVLGLPLVLLKGAELYRKEAADKETIRRYGHGTPDDKIEVFYQRFSKTGLILMFIIDVLLFGVPGIAMAMLQFIWIPFFGSGVINGIGHFWGYRNFECPDQARNVMPVGILMGGEEMHNNHHTYPTSAKFSSKWWEFDIGWLYIRLFETLGLAKVKRVQPEPALIPGKSQIDMETVKAVLVNRFQVMARYSKDVILPIFQQETEKARDPMLKRVKGLLIREASLLDMTAKQRLAQAIANYRSVNVVYQFKERLQDLWRQTAEKEQELLDALQSWCQEAEATGISVLKDFVGYIKSVSLKPA